MARLEKRSCDRSKGLCASAQRIVADWAVALIGAGMPVVGKGDVADGDYCAAARTRDGEGVAVERWRLALGTE